MLELNKVYNEDCLQTMKRMDDDFIDLVVTSPPYGDLRDYHGYSFVFEDIARELYRVIKPGGIVVWVIGDQTRNFCESLTTFKQAIYFVDGCGFNLLDTMIYQKDGSYAYNASCMRYMHIFEYMLVLSKGKPKTFNALKDRKNKCYFPNEKSCTFRTKKGDMRRSGSWRYREYGTRHNIWVYSAGMYKSTKDKIAYKHPAIFPDKLAEDHIKSWSNPGDVVYDPFLGSGTTAKAAKLLEREYVGSELSEEYCRIANTRIVSQNS